MSHDLRTPLAAILGLAVTLQRQSLEPEQIKELAGRIATNARKLHRMVTDLLDLDRISRGMVAPELRPLNLGNAVAGVVGESELVTGRVLSIEVEDVSSRSTPRWSSGSSRT